MSQKAPDHYPITGICIVADGQKCPPGYDLLLKSHDKREECDLGVDSILRRNQRYLCISRTYNPSGQGRNNVLTGIQVLNEKEIPPSGYSVIDRTSDTGEKALKKKQIDIKMSPRDASTDAICDVILLSKMKRAPEGYTLAGEINGLSLCYKLGKVPVETQSFSHSAADPSRAALPNRPAPLPPIGSQAIPPAVNAEVKKPPAPVPAPRPAAAARTVQRQDSVVSNPLADVTFQLNVKHQDFRYIMKNTAEQERCFRSAVDINNEYDYQFALERTAVQLNPRSP